MPGRIPAAFIDGLLARVDIVEVINRYVPLQRRGREHVACCPFHDEKTPSFKVNADKQFYHCFGCGAGGSVIQFLMEHQRMQFVEAVETLAEQCGLEVPREGGGGSSRDTARFKKLLGALDRAARYYRAQLGDHIEAANYFRSRGLSPETQAAFGLGYAPPASGHLRKCFGADYDEALLLEAGLLSKGERGAYERFRDRAMFPIRDGRGRTIAFGGRLLPGREGMAKYLNSSESPLFRKRETLYGLYELKQARGFDRVVVVEGYMDVVSLAQHGVRNAAATLGTATTRAQVQALFRITPHIVFCFDGDRAGGEAAARAAEQALPVFSDGREMTFMFLPEGHDPDSFVRDNGGDAFAAAGGDALPLAAFLFRHHGAGLDLSDPAAAAVLVSRLKPLIGQLPRGGVFRDLMFGQLAEKVGVSADSLKNAPSQAKPAAPARRAAPRTGAGVRYSRIRIAVRSLLEQPQLAEAGEWDELALDTGDIRRLDERGARLLADLVENIRRHKPATTAGVLELYRDTGEEQAFRRLLAEPAAAEVDRKSEFLGAMNRLEKDLEAQGIKREIAELAAKNAPDESDRRQLGQLQTRLLALKKA